MAFGIIMTAQRKVNNIGMALKTVLQKAKEEDRLVCGVYECAQTLQNIPEDVALCLLLEVADTEDVAAHIQHKLVEAFCWENDIQVVKVDSFKTVAKVLTNEKTEAKNDVGCILIQNAKSVENQDTFIHHFLMANQTSDLELPD